MFLPLGSQYINVVNYIIFMFSIKSSSKLLRLTKSTCSKYLIYLFSSVVYIFLVIVFKRLLPSSYILYSNGFSPSSSYSKSLIYSINSIINSFLLIGRFLHNLLDSETSPLIDLSNKLYSLTDNSISLFSIVLLQFCL